MSSLPQRPDPPPEPWPGKRSSMTPGRGAAAWPGKRSRTQVLRRPARPPKLVTAK